MHVIIRLYIETVKIELKIISEKYQKKNNFTLNNAFCDARLIQTPDMIKEIDPPVLRQLYDGTWMRYNHLPFLK